ncbi:MAG: acetoacetate--CoA ligase [Myxococcales bacterium]|nr:MAG: acetoacetate--CoA ligase [Myxococcales bacterium]
MPLWSPTEAQIAQAKITQFASFAGKRFSRHFDDYESLHRWSTEYPEEFWAAVYDYCGIIDHKRGSSTVSNANAMPGARWFEGTQLNFAENLLRRKDDDTAIIFVSEQDWEELWSYRKLYDEVSRIEQAMAHMGLAAGDVVVGWLPNLPQTLALALAASARGIVWASCSTDFGVNAVLDRFSQLEPKLLFVADHYSYQGKRFSCEQQSVAISEAIPSLLKTIIVPYPSNNQPSPTRIPEALDYDQWTQAFAPRTIDFQTLPFDHPLYVLFSSGTTGKPKGIIHGAGGTLIQHLKEHQFHTNITRDTRVFYFTTCGWMMWNWLISALASEACIILYDGSPVYPRTSRLFDLIDRHRINVFGVSAKYLDMLKKQDLSPRQSHTLSSLETVLSTGSPLSAEGFDFVYSQVKESVQLSSISGGTDIVSCFVLGNPALPVYRGEIQCKGLGMDVAVFSESGEAVVAETGELVCRKAFPSMPLGFWNDPEQTRYKEAYFSKFEGIWHHGDFAEISEHQGIIIHGRSDTTLNPGGVRIGTAEIYRQVEQLDEISEAVVIGHKHAGDERIVLFVRLRPGLQLDRALCENIKSIVRNGASPRHVPQFILQVTDIPRTKSGKISEMAVRAAAHGQSLKNLHALANPEALEHPRTGLNLNPRARESLNFGRLTAFVVLEYTCSCPAPTALRSSRCAAPLCN